MTFFLFLDIKPISYGSKFFLKKLLIFEIFFFGAKTQNPTPQLKVFNISLSEILFFFSQLKIFLIFIFDRSMLSVKFSGTDLSMF